MLARWTIEYGLEFAESKRNCKMSGSRLALHLAGLVLHLERDPYRYSEPYGDENHRAMDTADYFRDEGGAVLSAFVTLRPEEFVAVIQWIAAGPLPSASNEPTG